LAEKKKKKKKRRVVVLLFRKSNCNNALPGLENGFSWVSMRREARDATLRFWSSAIGWHRTVRCHCLSLFFLKKKNYTGAVSGRL
jgi:hypothetical protein